MQQDEHNEDDCYARCCQRLEQRPDDIPDDPQRRRVLRADDYGHRCNVPLAGRDRAQGLFHDGRGFRCYRNFVVQILQDGRGTRDDAIRLRVLLNGIDLLGNRVLVAWQIGGEMRELRANENNQSAHNGDGKQRR